MKRKLLLPIVMASIFSSAYAQAPIFEAAKADRKPNSFIFHNGNGLPLKSPTEDVIDTFPYLEEFTKDDCDWIIEDAGTGNSYNDMQVDFLYYAGNWNAPSPTTYLRSGPDYSKARNAWAYSPGIKLLKGQEYIVTVWFCGNGMINYMTGNVTKEEWKVTAGKTRSWDSQHVSIISKVDLQAVATPQTFPNEFVQYEGRFKAPESGTFYFGINHCTSALGIGHCGWDDFKIELGEPPTPKAEIRSIAGLWSQTEEGKTYTQPDPTVTYFIESMTEDVTFGWEFDEGTVQTEFHYENMLVNAKFDGEGEHWAKVDMMSGDGFPGSNVFNINLTYPEEGTSDKIWNIGPGENTMRYTNNPNAPWDHLFGLNYDYSRYAEFFYLPAGTKAFLKGFNISTSSFELNSYYLGQTMEIVVHAIDENGWPGEAIAIFRPTYREVFGNAPVTEYTTFEYAFPKYVNLTGSFWLEVNLTNIPMLPLENQRISFDFMNGRQIDYTTAAFYANERWYTPDQLFQLALYTSFAWGVELEFGEAENENPDIPIDYLTDFFTSFEGCTADNPLPEGWGREGEGYTYQQQYWNVGPNPFYGADEQPFEDNSFLWFNNFGAAEDAWEGVITPNVLITREKPLLVFDLENRYYSKNVSHYPGPRLYVDISVDDGKSWLLGQQNELALIEGYPEVDAGRKVEINLIDYVEQVVKVRIRCISDAGNVFPAIDNVGITGGNFPSEFHVTFTGDALPDDWEIIPSEGNNRWTLSPTPRPLMDDYEPFTDGFLWFGVNARSGSEGILLSENFLVSDNKPIFEFELAEGILSTMAYDYPGVEVYVDILDGSNQWTRGTYNYMADIPGYPTENNMITCVVDLREHVGKVIQLALRGVSDNGYSIAMVDNLKLISVPLNTSFDNNQLPDGWSIDNGISGAYWQMADTYHNDEITAGKSLPFDDGTFVWFNAAFWEYPDFSYLNLAPFTVKTYCQQFDVDISEVKVSMEEKGRGASLYLEISTDGKKWARKEDLLSKLPGHNIKPLTRGSISSDLTEYLGQEIHIRLTAVSDHGAFIVAVDNMKTTYLIPEEPLTPVSGLSATQQDQDVTLTWDGILYKSGDVAPSGFNVYRDGELIAGGIAVKQYTDRDVRPGMYTYCVSVVQKEKESQFECIEFEVEELKVYDDISTGFESNLLPKGWMLEVDNARWEFADSYRYYVNEFGLEYPFQDEAFAWFDGYEWPAGASSSLISPLFRPSDTRKYLSFELAEVVVAPEYAKLYEGIKLFFEISTDKGESWTANNFNELARIEGYPLTNDKISITKDLSGYIGQTIKIRFKAISDNGYTFVAIDNISLGSSIPNNDGTPIEQVLSDVSAYPSISTGNVTIKANGSASATVTDLSGRKLDSYTFEEQTEIVLNYDNGVYLIAVECNNKVFVYKIILKR